MVQRTRSLSPLKAFQEAVACHEQKRLLEAEQLYEIVLETDGRHFGAMFRLGLLYLQQGRHDDAAQHIWRAIKIDKTSSDAHHMLALALTGLDRHEEAIIYYRKAVAINPKYAEAPAHYNLANALHALNRSEEAIMHYWKAVAIDPKYTEAYNNLGLVLQMLGRAEEAIGCYQKALTINPNYAEAHNNLGIVLRAIGRIDEALQPSTRLSPWPRGELLSI